MRTVLLALLSLVACKPTAQTSAVRDDGVVAPSGRFDYALVHSIVTNPALEIRTIAQFLDNLPEQFRSSYVLMHTSGSSQKATLKAPRVVLFEPQNATFALSFNGDPSLEGYDTLETWEFDTTRKEFIFREISFDDVGKKELPEAPGTPAEGCNNCHEQSLRPNWEQWPEWPGAYFGRDIATDQLSEDESKKARAQLELERASFADFVKNAPSHERYKHLRGLDRLLADRRAQENGEPNNTYNQKLLTLQSQKVSAEIVRNPDYPRLRWAVAAALLKCHDVAGFVPAADKARFLGERQRIAAASTGRASLATVDDLRALFGDVRIGPWKLSKDRKATYQWVTSIGDVGLRLEPEDPELRAFLAPFADKDRAVNKHRQNQCAGLRMKALAKTQPQPDSQDEISDLPP